MIDTDANQLLPGNEVKLGTYIQERMISRYIEQEIGSYGR